MGADVNGGRGMRAVVGDACSAGVGVVIWVVVVMAALAAMCRGHDWYLWAGGRPTGEDLLHFGFAGRERTWAREALDRGASVNAKDTNGMTPLMWAAADGDVAVVRRLITAGADVSAASENLGCTPLGMAAQHGHAEAIEVLVTAGAAVDQRNLRHRGTPLHDAAGWGRTAAVAALLARGADPTARDAAGRTPLDRAAGEGDDRDDRTEIHRLLSDAAAERSTVEPNLHPPVQAAARARPSRSPSL